jgi:MFS family permease
MNAPPIPTPTRVVALTTFATIMLAAAVAQGFGRFTFGVVLPDVREDLLGGSNTLGGFVATANTFAYLVGALLVGSLSAKVSPVNSVRIGLVFSVGGLAAASVAPNAAVLTLAMIAMGLGGAAIWIPSPGIASTLVATHLRGLAVGLTGAGVGLGIIFSGRLNGQLVAGGGNWRDVYTVHAGIGLVTIVLVFAILRDRSGTQPNGGFGGFAVLRTLEGWKPITGCYFIYGFGYLLILAFLTSRLQDDSGFSEATASTIFAIMGACTIFGGVALGRVSDLIGRRRTLIYSFPLWAVAVGLILTGELAVVIVGAVIVGFLFGGIPSVIAAYLVDRTDAATYGPSYAAATFAFGVAQVSSPQIGGLIADWRGSFTLVFVVSATAMTSGALFAWALPRGS